ncbi:MAG: PadR family transcriptional regulator [Desulfurococcales archaeon]|nr:PadR family transcriptional regulator [Desulfurococcales archaeon]
MKREKSGAAAIYRESLKSVILRILAEGPRHGYDIMKRIEEVTMGRWRKAAGTIYPLLESMKEEGLIEVVEVVETGVRGGKRVVYGLTEKGWKTLADILVDKAKVKLRFVEWMLIEGSKILREKGLKEPADEICRVVRDEVKRLEECMADKCG